MSISARSVTYRTRAAIGVLSAWGMSENGICMMLEPLVEYLDGKTSRSSRLGWTCDGNANKQVPSCRVTLNIWFTRTQSALMRWPALSEAECTHRVCRITDQLDALQVLTTGTDRELCISSLEEGKLEFRCRELNLPRPKCARSDSSYDVVKRSGKCTRRRYDNLAPAKVRISSL